MSDTIVENKVTRAGLRYIHAICGSKPDPAEWMGQWVPMASLGEATMSLEAEKGLGIWHLRLWWPCRELVEMPMQAVQNPPLPLPNSGEFRRGR